MCAKPFHRCLGIVRREQRLLAQDQQEARRLDPNEYVLINSGSPPGATPFEHELCECMRLYEVLQTKIMRIGQRPWQRLSLQLGARSLPGRAGQDLGVWEAARMQGGGGIGKKNRTSIF